MRVKTIKVAVSRTVQVERFEPVQVTVEAVADLGPDDDVKESKLELYKGVTRATKQFIDNEVLKYTKDKKERNRE